MSTQRYIDTSFWDDTWVQELDPSEKLLYIYLLTNPLTNIAGVMELTIKRICFDTGFNADTVTRILGKFEDARKVFKYNNYIIIRNFPKHQQTENEKILKGIASILCNLPKDVLYYLEEIGYQLDIKKTFEVLYIPYTPPTNNLKEYNTNLKELNTNKEPVYIQKTIPEEKKPQFLLDVYTLINNHNQNAKKKIPISKDYFQFQCKEGRELAELCRQEKQEVIISALQNYLKVANSNTWKTGFTFSAFCRNFVEYTPEFFDMTRYVNLPKDKVKFIDDFLDRMIREKHIFREQTFLYHRKEWFAMGMPEGEELVALVNKWLEQDEADHVNYSIALENWENEDVYK